MSKGSSRSREVTLFADSPGPWLINYYPDGNPIAGRLCGTAPPTIHKSVIENLNFALPDEQSYPTFLNHCAPAQHRVFNDYPPRQSIAGLQIPSLSPVRRVTNITPTGDPNQCSQPPKARITISSDWNHCRVRRNER